MSNNPRRFVSGYRESGPYRDGRPVPSPSGWPSGPSHATHSRLEVPGPWSRGSDITVFAPARGNRELATLYDTLDDVQKGHFRRGLSELKTSVIETITRVSQTGNDLAPDNRDTLYEWFMAGVDQAAGVPETVRPPTAVRLDDMNRALTAPDPTAGPNQAPRVNWEADVVAAMPRNKAEYLVDQYREDAPWFKSDPDKKGCWMTSNRKFEVSDSPSASVRVDWDLNSCDRRYTAALPRDKVVALPLRWIAIAAKGDGNNLRLISRSRSVKDGKAVVALIPGHLNHDASHLCHNSACFNPDHLVVEPQGDNLARKPCAKAFGVIVKPNNPGTYVIHPCPHGATTAVGLSCRPTWITVTSPGEAFYIAEPVLRRVPLKQVPNLESVD